MLLLEHTGLVRCMAYHLFRRCHHVNIDDLKRAGMSGLHWKPQAACPGLPGIEAKGKSAP